MIHYVCFEPVWNARGVELAQAAAGFTWFQICCQSQWRTLLWLWNVFVQRLTEVLAGRSHWDDPDVADANYDSCDIFVCLFHTVISYFWVIILHLVDLSDIGELPFTQLQSVIPLHSSPHTHTDVAANWQLIKSALACLQKMMFHNNPIGLTCFCFLHWPFPKFSFTS